MVAFTGIAGVGSVAGAYVRYGWSLAALLAVAVAVQSAALWWRRRYPLAVLLVIVAVELGAIVSTPDREPGGVGLAFAVYAVSVYGPARARLIVAASAIAVILVAVVVLILGNFPTARVLIPSGAFSLVAWVIGDYMRNRRALYRDLMEQHRHERDRAAEEERLRIARELHDVVAHNVSVIAIQAGAARVSGSSSTDALATIEQSARDTLAELNKLLGVLRKKETGADRAPQPTLDDIEALLKPARDAGLRATLKVTGEKRRLSAALDLSAYRIIQEAITNVLKHANASRVEVIVNYRPDAVAVTISDNGAGPGPQNGGSNGHGLAGMRERVALFGGDLSTGTSALGGFTVRATLPVKT